MLKFENPDYLYLLVLIPVLALVLFIMNIKDKRNLRNFIGEALINQLVPEISYYKKVTKQILVLLSLTFLILALANPMEGTRLEEVKREGIDLFVALDVSLSMKAEDIKPNRLEKAKRDVSELLRKLSGDRVGMIVFAGESFVQFPLTTDYTAADLFISAIDVDVVPVPGTAIGSAIKMALKSFQTDLPTQKAIVIVSDGENTEGDVWNAVEEAKKAGVRIYTVGMGTPDGAPIPIYDQNGVRIDYKRDVKGSIVLSKLDEPVLQQIAVSTGGTYRRATSGGNEINDIYDELSSLEKVEFGTKRVTGYETRYQYPLMLALIFLIIELLISERKSKLFAILRKLIPASVGLLVFIMLPFCINAQTVRSLVKDGNKMYEKEKYVDAEVEYKKALQKDPHSKEARFNLGNAYYKQQRYEEAVREYNTNINTMNSDEKADNFYNIGNSLYKMNKFQEAIQAYKQSLKLNPKDEEARYNLCMAIEKLKQQQNQKNQQQQQDKQQQENQKNQQQNREQNQQQNQQQEEQQNDRKQTEQQVRKKNEISKEEAERILDVMRNNEKEVQKNIRKREAVRVRVEKDW